ncbi:MAG TPA: hypothetical protein VGJ97_07960 [Anaerolineaceae bacterium]
MKHPSRFLIISQISAVLFLGFIVWSPNGGLAFPMRAALPKDPIFNRLKNYLEDVPAATASRFNAVDSAGHSMDTAKIIANPAGGYLAVYHTRGAQAFEVHLAVSTDLIHWEYRQSYGSHTHQPYLAAAPGGGFVLANEADNGVFNWIQVRYYPNRADLFANHPSHSIDLPHTQVPARHSAEGTPSVEKVTFSPDSEHSSIEIGFHYFRDGSVDRQARGVLTNFSDWSAQPEPNLDAGLLASGIQGNIGDRDQVSLGDRIYRVCEGQFKAGDFSTWRVFLGDASGEHTIQLDVRTPGGSQAFANPTFSLLPSPNGGRALVVTYFMPGGGPAPKEAGKLIFYRDLPE